MLTQTCPRQIDKMSAIFDHILDPDDDMKLVLRNPNKQFAPWSEQHSTRYNSLEKSGTVRSQTL